jgi:DNA-binding FadR family transcriptional regulator
MRDIARAAGCSQTTVSFILNHKPGLKISLELRKRVTDIARDVGYGAARAAMPRGHRDGGSGAGRHAPKRAPPLLSQTGRVVRAIGLAIISNRLPPNSILPRDGDLLAHFGVSRTVLREALKVLAGKQLLLSRARIGTKVRDRSEWNFFDPDLLAWHVEAGIDDEFMKHVEEIRWALEPQAAALAAERGRAADIARLYAHVERMNMPAVRRRDFVAADIDFHVDVAKASANPFLRAITALIEVALVEAFTRSWPGDEPGGAARSTAHHRAIVDAIARRDATGAGDAMRVVLADASRKLRRT